MPLTTLTMDSVQRTLRTVTSPQHRTSTVRQPIHTMYGGAHLFRADTVQKIGDLAKLSLDTYAHDPTTLVKAMGIERFFTVPSTRFAQLYQRVVHKLQSNPVEDYRIDFEDGLGPRSDEEEDTFAANAAIELSKYYAKYNQSTARACMGIRVRSLNETTAVRAARTLDIFLTTLCQHTTVPEDFVVALPKVTHHTQTTALATLLTQLEQALSIKQPIKTEIMVEHPLTLFAPSGMPSLATIVDGCEGRCIAAHLGAYDLTAACKITAHHQTLSHPLCTLVRSLMQLQLADHPVYLVDGATTTLPLAMHRTKDGQTLSTEQQQENQQSVHKGWSLHVENIAQAFAQGYYQGWDLHPAQLPARYAAVYAYFMSSSETCAKRLRHFVDQAAKAIQTHGAFDDLATARGLVNHFVIGLQSGALSPDEIEQLTNVKAERLTTLFK